MAIVAVPAAGVRGEISWRIILNHIFLSTLLATCLLLAKISYADPDFDSVVRVPSATNVVYARATLRFNSVPYCPGVTCQEMSYIAIYGGTRFGRFGLCTDSGYAFLRPCYLLTAQRTVIKLPYNFLPGQRAQVVVTKQGDHLVVTWTNLSTGFTTSRTFNYSALWSTSSSRSYSGVSIYSSDSRFNPPVNTILENVLPAGGVLTNDPPYYPVALSLSAWKLVKN